MLRDENKTKQQLILELENLRQRIAFSETMVVANEPHSTQGDYRSLFEQTNDGIFIIGLDDVFLECNQRASEILRCPASDIIGQSINKFTPSREIPDADRKRVELFNASPIPVYERILQRADGSEFVAEIEIAMVYDSEEQPSYWQSRVRDISKVDEIRQQLYHHHEFFSLLHQITLDILNFQDTPFLFRSIVSHASLIMDAPDAELMFIEGDELVVQACIGETIVLGERVKRNDATLSWKAFETTKTVVLDDYSQHPERRDIYEPMQFKAVACFPITIGQNCLGVLDLSRKESDAPFTADEIQQGEAFAQLIAVILNNIGQNEIIRRAVAEREQVEFDNLKLSHAVEQSVNSVLIINTDFNIEYVNPYFTALSGYTFEEVIGKKPNILESEFTKPEEYKRLLQTVESGEVWRSDFKNEKKNGESYWESVSISPIRDKDRIITHYVVVKDNITERILAKKQQIELAIKQDRIQLLEEVIGDFSHDVRTPITSIINNLYMLRKKDAVSKKSVRHLDKIEKQAQRLNKLVENILTMTRLDKMATMVFAPLSLNALIEELSSSYYERAEEKQLKLTFDLRKDLSLVSGNKEELSRALSNLIENAINYTPQGNSIHVKTSMQNKVLMVEVIDTGIGIGKDDIPHIFDRFYRADKARNTNQGGMGFGLAIVKKIIDLHGGNIEVQSIPEKGSTFKIRIPTTQIPHTKSSLKNLVTKKHRRGLSGNSITSEINLPLNKACV